MLSEEKCVWQSCELVVASFAFLYSAFSTSSWTQHFLRLFIFLQQFVQPIHLPFVAE